MMPSVSKSYLAPAAQTMRKSAAAKPVHQQALYAAAPTFVLQEHSAMKWAVAANVVGLEKSSVVAPVGESKSSNWRRIAFRSLRN